MARGTNMPTPEAVAEHNKLIDEAQEHLRQAEAICHKVSASPETFGKIGDLMRSLQEDRPRR
jgi:hypothetical protein